VGEARIFCDQGEQRKFACIRPSETHSILLRSKDNARNVSREKTRKFLAFNNTVELRLSQTFKE
jgi:hypothetical protein